MQVNVSVPKDVKERIDDLAEELGESRAVVVHGMIRMALGHAEGQYGVIGEGEWKKGLKEAVEERDSGKAKGLKVWRTS